VRLLFDGLFVVGAVLTLAVVWTLLASLIRFQRAMAAHARPKKAVSGVEGMVGELGQAVAPLEPEGKVFVHGEYWDAVARSSVPGGAPVRVVKVSGGRLEVEDARPAPNAPSAPLMH